MSAPIKLNPPVGYKTYGATQGFAPSAEIENGQPVYFFSQEGWGPSADNNGFGHYAFRQVGRSGRATYVYYKDGSIDPMDGRGDLLVGGDGLLYITGNESASDGTNTAYVVPGYVPFTSKNGQVSDPALLARLATLELKLANMSVGVVDARVADILKRLGDTEDVADKALSRAQSALEKLAALVIPAGGISYEVAFQAALDAVYGELGNAQSGISGKVLALVSSRLGGSIDQSARDIANAALKSATDAKTLAGQSAALAANIARGEIDTWLAKSIAYTDKRLLNLIWDRGVKLARFLKVPGAAQAPINDPKNVEA